MLNFIFHLLNLGKLQLACRNQCEEGLRSTEFVKSQFRMLFARARIEMEESHEGSIQFETNARQVGVFRREID